MQANPALRRAALRAGAVVIALLAPAWAPAQSPAAASNVVMLGASASTEVPQDWLTVVFTARREGSDAAAVQAQLRQAVDAALGLARAAARPGQIDVQTGGFSLAPRYAPPPRTAPAAGPVLAGWQGSAELIVQGRDVAGIAALTGRIHSMSIGRVGFALSPEARERVEAETLAQAIEHFRARAALVARQFGFAGYTLREATVSSEQPGPVPLPMMRAMAAPDAAPESLPLEAGKATVTVTVNGSVQLK